ncbi:MAG TPA: DUF3147 family protein [Solirubrobacteraceae bacterium]|nr:DUF3147 family protein [Solirubrobacteraceae bacterium]
MHELLILSIKGLAGGLLVVAFAVLSEALEPKRFAGLFSAAPAVAIASLSVVLLDKGHHDAHQDAVGMIAGSAGMIAYAACVISLLRRMKASHAAFAGLTSWVLFAGAAAIPVLVA